MCTWRPRSETLGSRHPAPRADTMPGMDRWWLKAALNVVNVSTPLGLLISVIGRARRRPGPRHLVLASDFRLGSWVRAGAPARAGTHDLRLPPAFTVGNVVVSPRPAEYLDARPALLAHEERHSWQYVVCLGLPMLPLYAVGAAWSYLRGGDFGVHNPFERLAGLADGGYPLVSARERRRAHQRRPDQPRPRPTG